MSWSAQAAITKYHGLGGLNIRNLFSHSSGGWKSKIKVPAHLVSGDGSLPGLQMVPSHDVLTWSFFGMCTRREKEIEAEVEGEGEREERGRERDGGERERALWCLFL